MHTHTRTHTHTHTYEQMVRWGNHTDENTSRETRVEVRNFVEKDEFSNSKPVIAPMFVSILNLFDDCCRLWVWLCNLWVLTKDSQHIQQCPTAFTWRQVWEWLRTAGKWCVAYLLKTDTNIQYKLGKKKFQTSVAPVSSAVKP